jgi:hypothetical protein
LLLAALGGGLKKGRDALPGAADARRGREDQLLLLLLPLLPLLAPPPLLLALSLLLAALGPAEGTCPLAAE